MDFTKTVRLGRTYEGAIICKITFVSGKLSITGDEGPNHGGQIVMGPWEIHSYHPGWDAEMVSKFREIWENWHLNDMQAGSPAQTKFLKENPVKGGLKYYEKACDSLRAAGLQPDPGYLHNGKPYRYGSTWLRVEVPQDVVDWLSKLPGSDR